MNNELTLHEVLAALRAKHPRDAPSYQQLYRAIVEARVPAAKSGNRWTISSQDLPKVECGLGMPTRRWSA